MRPQKIHQMHRDHVPTVPEGFDLLGSSSGCDVHGMVRFVEDEGVPHTVENVSILTLQGASSLSLSLSSFPPSCRRSRREAALVGTLA